MIAIVDANAFYCSCERVFNPGLKDRPVIILSNNDGCAISRSDEAKAVGINMGMPFFMMQEIIRQHQVQVFSSNYTLYGDMSSRVMAVLNGYTPYIEHYSIDEAFLDLSGVRTPDLHETGCDIRNIVDRNTGIPVTVGIAPTKTLAKMANRFAKKTRNKAGVHCLGCQKAIDEVLQYTEVGDIWGIGKQYGKLLQQHGFYTAADLVKAPDEWIRKNLSVVGQRMVTELRGVPAIKWEETPPPKKAICTSRSFGYLVEDKMQLQEAVANYAANVALKLRKQHSCATQLQVFIQTNPFRTEDKQYYRSVDLELPLATNCSRKLIKYALKCLDIVYTSGYKFLKAGVTATGIVPESTIQYSLFDVQDPPENKQLMGAIDSINRSFGRDLVRFAVQGYEKKWRLRADHLSQRYTTNWDELLLIKI